MLLFFSNYGTALLRFAVLVLWLIYFLHIDLNEKSHKIVRYFVIYLSIFTIWNIIMILSQFISADFNRISFLVFWSLVNLFELYMIINVIFLFSNIPLKYTELKYLVLSIFSIPIILAPILTWTYKSYAPVNTMDFYNLILFMMGTIYIEKMVLFSSDFPVFIEVFFIYAGFTLDFGLHILASNVISINFIGNYNFSQFATLVSLIFWIGSVFFIWKIRSKHS